MTRKEAEKVVEGLNEDERYDLIMHLAEQFGFRVQNEDGEDVTFFLSTG